MPRPMLPGASCSARRTTGAAPAPEDAFSDPAWSAQRPFQAGRVDVEVQTATGIVGFVAQLERSSLATPAATVR
ncbi:hypothetical protein OG978_01960 [Streptomyces sp. NBC_01591]|uniref:hypothetical protein n=1 Tax=Streptomyces sp. NBC_01591 TaxID=2975888 RepID=UPI002DD8613E|nr:hypothetical protein [Streptomyces sp. NBC_01591]WSD66294.1 hypothetical protein OG978_01960 [Streptomyces sp. NBC_01591]